MAIQAENLPVPFQTSKSERTAYGFYFFGQNVFYIIVLNFLQIFLTDQGITASHQTVLSMAHFALANAPKA